jgi:MFS family permease
MMLAFLAPFRIRSYRFQWPADLVTSWAFEMETLILGWYIIVETGSVVMLSVFGTMLYTGTLIAPLLGVASDRVGHRNLLSSMRAAYAAIAATLMLAAFAGALSPTLVCVLAAVMGLLRPSDQGLRGALIAETMPLDLLVGAMGFSRGTSDSARVAGALTGAGLFTAFGIAPAYVMITGLYALGALLTLGTAPSGVWTRAPTSVRPRESGPVYALRASTGSGDFARRSICEGGDPALVKNWMPASAGTNGESEASSSDRRLSAHDAVEAPKRPSPWRDLREGIRAIWNTPQLAAIVWLAFLFNLTAFSITNGLLPYVAREVYRVDQTGLGWLVASVAFGALLGSIALSRPRIPVALPRLMIVAAVIWHVLLLAFAQMTGLAGGMACLLFVGFASSLTMVAHSVILLRSAEPRLRGRVLGVRMLAIYSLPLGLLAAGALIERIGFRATISLYGIAGIVFTALIALRWRAWQWQVPAPNDDLPR